ncbi:unnamed protein product [Cuscuta campestris]|uniref:Uncharacterized protein n=1 Tax=Cuscuta campestris TaxID=132261 RepID=A0A484LJ06_9ASTE|nr:unnamed protein product [Cuscuta campestris]
MNELHKIQGALVQRQYLMKKNLALTRFGCYVCALATGTSVFVLLSSRGSRESTAPAGVAARAPAAPGMV